MTSSAFSEARVQPFYCPYCGEEDFVPSASLSAGRRDDLGEGSRGPTGSREEADGGYHCRSCDRRFAVRFLGLGRGAERG
jgi:hypothetical protein